MDRQYRQHRQHRQEKRSQDYISTSRNQPRQFMTPKELEDICKSCYIANIFSFRAIRMPIKAVSSFVSHMCSCICPSISSGTCIRYNYRNKIEYVKMGKIDALICILQDQTDNRVFFSVSTSP
jgi:hypothetical protein